MTDQTLTDLLERAGERIPAGTPPLRQMIDDAGRARRLRRARLTGALGVVSIASVVGVVLGGPALFSSTDSRTPPTAAPQDPTSSPSGETLPRGRRLVGVGNAAIAVPEGWATNAIRCGTAEQDTVVIDVTTIETCSWSPPKSFASVWVERGADTEMFFAAEQIEIDGVAAQRSAVGCAGYSYPPVICSGAVYVPSADAMFRVNAYREARVEEIMSWVHVLDNVVAVPGFGESNLYHQREGAGEHYRTALETAGLGVEVVTEPGPGMPAGYVLDVSPAPGTMLEPGQTVTVTEVAEPRGPADLVRVDLGSLGPGDSDDYRGRTDAQLRAGTRIELEVGSRLWVHGYGKGISTLAGELSGEALELDDWKEGPNYGHSWLAVAPGTTVITVTITADGERVVIGTVTVVVR